MNTVVNLTPKQLKKSSHISSSMLENVWLGVDNVSGPFQCEDFVSPSLDKQEKLDLNSSRLYLKSTDMRVLEVKKGAWVTIGAFSAPQSLCF